MPKQESLQTDVANCRQCSRLIDYIENQRFRPNNCYKGESYHSAPVSGFGDAESEMLIVGLAPGAHGANRVGRMFSGDASGDWLFRALFETGFSNLTQSKGPGDGLQLNNCFITSAVKCAPPNNLPNALECANCRPFLIREIERFASKLIICLGTLAHREVHKALDLKQSRFAHGAELETREGRRLISSYHPSRYNQQTKRLTWPMWIRIFDRAKFLLK